MHGGNFDLFVFETNSADSPYASILSNYTIGATLFTSPFALLKRMQATVPPLTNANGFRSVRIGRIRVGLRHARPERHVRHLIPLIRVFPFNVKNTLFSEL